MKVPLVDLRSAYLPIKAELFAEFEAILDSMNLFLGPNVQELEREFAVYCGAARGIGVSNGTDALYAALKACGVGPGDEVILPSHTFFATVEAVAHAGATPVLVDVEPDTLTIDPGAAGRAVTSATRALLPVHLYGCPADMGPLLELAREHDLRVIEDSAQAHGARYRGRRCGSLGDAGCFSFYFTKNLGAFGEGGFVATSSDAVANHVEMLRHHGHVSKFEHAILGHNLRLDELQAAVLRLKLRTLDAGNEKRRGIARRYGELLADAPVRPVGTREDSECVHHLYVVRASDRDALRDHLTAAGVGTGIHYKVPCHLQPALRECPHRVHEMEVTEKACAEILSLPIFPELTDEQVEYVAHSVREFYGGAAKRSTGTA